jgi:hypothetical protein
VSSHAVEILAVGDVTVDPAYQMRAGGLDAEYAGELAEVVRAGKAYKERPVVFRVARKGKPPELILAGGFHRHRGYELAGVAAAEYEVRDGTALDAKKYALGDNADHGRRRTTQDIRRAVEAALADKRLAGLSDREIDALCGVSVGYTSRLRKELTGAAPDAKKSQAAKARNAKPVSETEAPAAPPTPGAAGGGEAQPGAELPHPEPPPSAFRDQLGRPCPSHIDDHLRRGRGMLAAAARLDAEIDALANKGISAGRAEMIDARNRLAWAAPFCVCPACSGHGDKGRCPTCGADGFLDFAAYCRLPDPLRAAADAASDDAHAGEVPACDEPPRDELRLPPGRDAAGQPYPKRLRDVFADTTLPAVSSALRRHAAQLKSASAWAVHLPPDTYHALEQIAEQVSGARAYRVCPNCTGKGCEACHTGGYLPVAMRHELGR